MNATSSSHPELSLIAVPRPLEIDRGNLFVRLAPRTAWRLASLIFSSPNHDGDPNITDEEFLVPDVDFLPLEIVISQRDPQGSDKIDDVGDGNIVVYASYNGGAPSPAVRPSQPYGSSTNNEDIIELPIDLHPSLQSIFNSTSEPVVVSVRPLSNVPISERVTFEPLTISDWEMIEMEASVLEDGGLLNQITVVYPGQIFPIQFGGHLDGLAWIKIVDEDFGTSSNQRMDTQNFEQSDTSLASDSDFDSSTDSSSDEYEYNSLMESGDNSRCRHRCVRLMAETEVAVIPKPRIRQEEPSENEIPNECPSNDKPIYCTSTPLRVQLVCSDLSHEVSIAEESPSLPNPPLGSVCVHPSTLVQIPGYQQCIEAHCHSGQNGLKEELPPMVVTIRKVGGPYSPQFEAGQKRGTGCDVAVATIHASECAHKGHIGMHALLCYQLGVRPFADWVSLQLWSESHVMDSINSVHDGTEKIVVAKMSSTSQFENRPALQPWKSPFVNCTAQCSTSGMDHSTCECCRKNSVGNIDKKLTQSTAMMQHDIFSPAPLFCHGSIVPVNFIQHINDADMFVLKLHPHATPPDKNNCMSSATTGLVPILTANSLKDLLQSDIIIETSEREHGVSLEAHDFLAMPFSEKATVGFSSAIQSVKQSAREIISSHEIKDANPIFCTSESIHKHAIMITGKEGSGKSHLSNTSASLLSLSDLCATVYLDCKELQATSSSIQFILEAIHKSFQEARHNQPSVLVLDDLDALIPNVESSGAEGEGSIHHHQLNPALVVQVKIIVDHLFLESQHCRLSGRSNNLTTSTGVVLICTCSDKDSLSIRYQESGVFHSSVEVPSLDSFQRSQFVHNHVFGKTLVSSTDRIPHAIARLGKDTEGFRPRDLKICATRIVHLGFLRNFHRESPQLDCCLAEQANPSLLKTLELDIASIIDEYSPLSQQLVDVQHNTCSMDWSSIGGLYNAKLSLHDIVIHPMKFKSVYDNAPTTLPTGVLLYGPPGNGKSFIVPLLAKKSKLNLITCRGPELLDRYIGASEAKVRQLFARATAAAPAIIFFDEFDSLAPQRGSDHTGVTDRVVNQLLTLLDGAEQSKNAGHIFVVAATSRPDKIDKALLRPGRLEKHVYVGYPESLLEWNSLFSAILKARNVDDEVSRLDQAQDLFNSFCKDFDYAKDFSAADMKAVLDTAHLLCVREILDAHNGGSHGPAILGKRHILEAFRRTKPSMLSRDRQVLQSIYASFGKNQIREESSDHQQPHGLKTSLR
ncbi:hypothetical protein ACHAXR_008670 [Thalassiosira sp. AJA248-18]